MFPMLTKMIKVSTTTILVMLSVCSWCEELTLGFRSYHADRDKGYNEANWGVLYSQDSGMRYLTYLNSHERISLGVGYAVYTNQYFELTFAAISGYTDYPVLFTPIPSITLGPIKLVTLPGIVAVGYTIKM